MNNIPNNQQSVHTSNNQTDLTSTHAQPVLNIHPLAIVDSTVVVEQGATIEAFAVVKGNSVIKSGALIQSHSYIVNSTIGDNTIVRCSYIIDSTVGDDCTVGPFAHIRQHSNVSSHCRIGDFVELKNATLGQNTKSAHLAYIGDATVGDNCNVGCGVVFVNYDGKRKHHTTVGDNCFIGCNSNIIAPVNMGNRCYVACSCTVEGDVPNDAFVIGRTRAIVKPDYAPKYFDNADKDA